MNHDLRSRCVHVRTQTNRHLAVYPVTEDVDGCGRVTASPFRAGYASNHPQAAGGRASAHHGVARREAHEGGGLRRAEPRAARQRLPARWPRDDGTLRAGALSASCRRTERTRLAQGGPRANGVPGLLDLFKK